MASPAPTPRKDHVYDIHGRLVAALNTDESSSYQNETEDIREMRFTLRKFIHLVIDLTESGSRDKSKYVEAARTAGEMDTGKEGAETISSRTGDILCSILEDAPWGLVKGVVGEAQEINVSLKGIRDGIKATIESLSASLVEDGTEDIEYEEKSQAPKTPTKARKPAPAKSTPSRTPKGPGNFEHGSARKWSDVENLEVLRVVRDIQGSHRDRALELNRRMEARGQSAEEARTTNALRLQIRKLDEAGTTLEDLEAALGVTEGDGEEGCGARECVAGSKTSRR